MNIGLWQRFKRGIARRAVQWAGVSLKDSEALGRLFSVPVTLSGVPVDETTAHNYSAFFAGVRALSQTVACLPVRAYTGEGRDRKAADHPIEFVLNRRPNPMMTGYTFKEVLQGNAVVHGNGYAEIVYDRGGSVRELWPIPSKSVAPRWKNDKTLEYVVNVDGVKRVMPWHAILHIRGYGNDGIQGLGMVQHARECISLGLAAQNYGAAYFGSGGRPDGVLTHPEALSDQARDNIRKEWADRHQGKRALAVLEEGVTYTKIADSPEDAQFLATRKFQVTEVARWLGVPPHLLGDLEHATFSNIEHQSLEFILYSLQPWCERWSQSLAHLLLTEAEEKAGTYFEMATDSLLRGDKASRYTANGQAVGSGWKTINEVRVEEGLEPKEGGDELRVPLNQGPAAGAPQPGGLKGPPEPGKRPIDKRCGGPGSGVPGPCPEGGAASSWMEKAKALPAKAVQFAKDKAQGLYDKMEAKYGSKWAKAILTTAIVTLPIPGSTLGVLAMTGLAAVASKYGYRNRIPESILKGAVDQLWADMQAEVHGYELTDEERGQIELLKGGGDGK